MLTIKNIDKVINMMCYGRDIYHVSTTTNKVNEQAYVFEFDAIQDGQVPKGYNKSQEVHLVRHADADGNYRLFLMGLQLGTERKVVLSEVKCLTSLLVEISEVLRTTKDWWEHSNLQNK
jgi:hypothetical protein